MAKFLLLFMFIAAVIAVIAEIVVFTTYNKKQMDKALSPVVWRPYVAKSLIAIFVILIAMHLIAQFGNSLLLLIIGLLLANIAGGLEFLLILNVLVTVPVCKALRRKLCIEFGGRDE